MACGAPVIATFNGASEHIIEEDCGLVVERINLIDALETALMRKHWNSDTISNKVAKYDMNVIADRLVDLFLDQLNRDVLPTSNRSRLI
jgi:glycosyltransferase involved in cell wall biosynthesis